MVAKWSKEKGSPNHTSKHVVAHGTKTLTNLVQKKTSPQQCGTEKSKKNQMTNMLIIMDYFLPSGTGRRSVIFLPSENCGECVPRVSATLQVFTPEWFLMAPLFDWSFWERLNDALCVLGVDHVEPIAVRVLVSW